MPSIGVIGADGRLGSRIVRAATAAGVPVTLHGSRAGWLGEPPDVLVDVSHASVLPQIAAYCRAHRVALLSAVSGLGPADRATLAGLAGEVPVLRAENLSLGHHLQRDLIDRLRPTLLRLHREGLGSLGIVDRHPAYKKDRPSATAQALRDRVSAGAADAPPVTIDSVRAGMPVCEHELRLALPDEEIVVAHAVRDWAAYAAMAVRAALWLTHTAGQPRLHTMADFYDELLGGGAGSGRVSTGGALNPAREPVPGELTLTRGA